MVDGQTPVHRPIGLDSRTPAEIAVATPAGLITYRTTARRLHVLT